MPTTALMTTDQLIEPIPDSPGSWRTIARDPCFEFRVNSEGCLDIRRVDINGIQETLHACHPAELLKLLKLVMRQIEKERPAQSESAPDADKLSGCSRQTLQNVKNFLDLRKSDQRQWCLKEFHQRWPQERRRLFQTIVDLVNRTRQFEILPYSEGDETPLLSYNDLEISSGELQVAREFISRQLTDGRLRCFSPDCQAECLYTTGDKDFFCWPHHRAEGTGFGDLRPWRDGLRDDEILQLLADRPWFPPED